MCSEPCQRRSGTGPWLGRGSALSGSAILLLHRKCAGVGRLQTALILRRRAPALLSRAAGSGDGNLGAMPRQLAAATRAAPGCPVMTGSPGCHFARCPDAVVHVAVWTSGT